LVDPNVPDAGDVVWLDFDPQSGHEQAGHRPALVLSSWQFNQRTSLAFVCPITSRIKGYSSEVALPPGSSVHGVVLCSHLRSVDWRSRNSKTIGKVNNDVLSAVRDIVAAIAGIPS
jgi:mRNA interferase MazF